MKKIIFLFAIFYFLYSCKKHDETSEVGKSKIAFLVGKIDAESDSLNRKGTKIDSSDIFKLINVFNKSDGLISYNATFLGTKIYFNENSKFNFVTNKPYYTVQKNECIETYQLGEAEFYENTDFNSSDVSTDLKERKLKNVVRINVLKEGIYDVNIFLKNTFKENEMKFEDLENKVKAYSN